MDRCFSVIQSLSVSSVGHQSCSRDLHVYYPSLFIHPAFLFVFLLDLINCLIFLWTSHSGYIFKINFFKQNQIYQNLSSSLSPTLRSSTNKPLRKCFFIYINNGLINHRRVRFNYYYRTGFWMNKKTTIEVNKITLQGLWPLTLFFLLRINHFSAKRRMYFNSCFTPHEMN